MENIVVWVADNKIDKELLKEIIEDIIMEEDREFVQLAIIRALQTNNDE
jgi:death-on-curing protein